MDIGSSSERLMGMNDAVWQRNANPISGWSRVPVLPLLAMGIWSRVWLGWWSLLPIGGILVWIRLNPRIFPIPQSTDNWMAKGVLGERVWLNRKNVPIPAHHSTMAAILNTLAGNWVDSIRIGTGAVERMGNGRGYDSHDDRKTLVPRSHGLAVR